MTDTPEAASKRCRINIGVMVPISAMSRRLRSRAFGRGRARARAQRWRGFGGGSLAPRTRRARVIIRPAYRLPSEGASSSFGGALSSVGAVP